MNSGQMLLVIGAIALFSTIAISVNSTLVDSEGVAVETQASIIAASLCQGEIETVAAEPFDSLAVGVVVDTLTTSFAVFMCTTRVDFVQATAPDFPVVGPTSLMRILVKVDNEFMAEGVTLRTIVGDY